MLQSFTLIHRRGVFSMKNILALFVCGMVLFASSGWAKNVAVLRLQTSYSSNLAYSGIQAGMAAKGYVEGAQLTVTQFDAQGDSQKLAELAQQIVNGNFDLAITLSTSAVEAMAKANLEKKIPHVFAFISTPAIVDIGVTEAGVHPAYMTGIYHPNPVPAAFQTAKEMYPALKKVGLIWNPAEKNSVYQTGLARDICATLNIELVEKTVTSKDEVPAMAQELAGQGIEAYAVTGDNTVMPAIPDIVGVARNARIPVFFNGSGGIDDGTLFDMGTNFFEACYPAGEMAGDILGGKSPADIPLVKYTTETLYLNLFALSGLKDPWTITADMKKRAAVTIPASNVETWEQSR